MSARVFLDKTFVGQLTPNVATQRAGFEFDASYAVQGARPVLGRWFEDHDISPPRRFDGSPLPNYFRNLLPEGALRKVIASRLGPSSLPEYSMLLRLGGDLPGAIRVVSDELDESPLDEQERKARPPHDPFRFALTGVQPKLSLYEAADKLTVPVEGEQGLDRQVRDSRVSRARAERAHNAPLGDALRAERARASGHPRAGD
ncbi:MAG TPA: HipA N-terminal domain-containing protein [Labilithrix sp.]|nr:HipA N-terminal domain-containing protein [Labilithrix sp.]